MGMKLSWQKDDTIFKQKFSSTSGEWASIMMKHICKEKLLHALSNNGDDNEHNNNNEKIMNSLHEFGIFNEANK